MTSSSSLGISQITIQFDLGRNIDGASLDVQTALAVAQRRLPVEMTTPPFFRKVNPGDFPVLYVSMRSDTMPLSAVDDYAETVLAPQISQLPGVAQVLVFGAQKFAVRVQVDPVAAAARNISLDDIRSVVAKANSSAPVGTLQGEQQAVTLLATGAMNHAADYRDVVVAYRNGAPVKLNEVARVIDSVENDKIATWFNDCARHRAGDPAPARRQHRRSGGPGAQQAAGHARANPARHQHGAVVRPLDLDPRRGASTCRKRWRSRSRW